MNLELSGKHFVVTGAAGGIGSVVSKTLLAEGAKLTLHYNNTKLDLSKFSDDEKSRIIEAKANIGNEQEVQSMFTQSNKKFGRIDGIVCNAGIWPKKNVSIKDMDIAQWENTLKVNLTGYYLSIKYFLQNLEEFPGEEASIVMIGSTAGVFGEAYHSDYSASKSALHGLMLSVKNEIVTIARKGRINIISPGWTVTHMAKETLQDDQVVTKVLQTIPLRKVAMAQDIANQVTLLLSSAVSGHVTGQNIVVAGGMEGRVLYNPDQIDLDRKLG